jgi:hypothetical protein
MPVEVSILSGARQGQRRVLDVNKFRAGSDPSFDVYFDPLVDSAAKDRAVALCLMDDGWYIQCTGKGDVFVNHTPVVGMMRIRSGSVVRMSEFGPEFEFSILARGKGTVNHVDGPLSAMPAPAPGPAIPPPPAFPPQQPRPVAPTPFAPPSTGSGRLPLWIGGGVLACLVLVGLAVLLQPGAGRAPAPPPGQGTSAPAPRAEETPVAAQSTTPGDANVPGSKLPSVPPTVWPPPAPPTPPAPPPTSTADLVRARLDGAVLLIQVEKYGHFWPFATCCALSDNTVLTTAREAYRLAAWRKGPGPGYKIWVTNPATGLKLAVKDIRVHGLFATLAAKPGDWIYCNLALLTVDGRLPKTAELASDEELSRLKEGHSVFCYGFTHEGDAITPEDKLEPVLTPGKVFIITAQRSLPGQPSVLHVRGDIPKFVYGSPVADENGKIVALYGEAASQPGGDAKASAPPLKLHYATVVNPDVVDLWLKKADGKIWISAAEIKAPVEAKPER